MIDTADQENWIGWAWLIHDDNFGDVMNERGQQLREVQELARQCGVLRDQGQHQRRVTAMDDLEKRRP